jgi:transcriptional regulator with XRE-family HTH domain
MADNAEQLGLIALRIRDLRDIAGLTARQVAEKTGISPEEYEAYETGTRDFSFSHLFNIAEALGVDISDCSGGKPKLHGYILTRAGQGLRFNRASSTNTISCL